VGVLLRSPFCGFLLWAEWLPCLLWSYCHSEPGHSHRSLVHLHCWLDHSRCQSEHSRCSWKCDCDWRFGPGSSREQLHRRRSGLDSAEGGESISAAGQFSYPCSSGYLVRLVILSEPANLRGSSHGRCSSC